METSIISREDGLIIKAMAIFLIVFQHVGQAFKISAVNPLGPIGVFLFLFMSGYGLTCSFIEKGREHYIWNKIKKVYLPYAFSVVVFALIQRLFFQNKISVFGLCQYLSLYSLPQGSHWYMQLILLWYIAFWFLSFFLKKTSGIFGTVIASILVLIGMRWNISAVWQVFSFPLGIAVALNQNKALEFKTKLKSIRGGGIAFNRYSVGCI